MGDERRIHDLVDDLAVIAGSFGQSADTQVVGRSGLRVAPGRHGTYSLREAELADVRPSAGMIQIIRASYA
jgi:hypothetical protein